MTNPYFTLLFDYFLFVLLLPRKRCSIFRESCVKKGLSDQYSAEILTTVRFQQAFNIYHLHSYHDRVVRAWEADASLVPKNK